MDVGSCELQDVDGGELGAPDARLVRLAKLTESLLTSRDEQCVVEFANSTDGWTITAVDVIPCGDATPIAELAGQPTIWSNANLKDAYPGVQSRFGWSMLELLMESAGPFAGVRCTGYKVPQAIRPARLINGRPYLNLSAIEWLFFDALGFLPAQTTASIGGNQPEITVASDHPLRGVRGIARIWRRVLLLVKCFGAWRSIRAQIGSLWPVVDAELKTPPQRDATEALATTIKWYRYIEKAAYFAQLVNMAAGVRIAMLMQVLEAVRVDNVLGTTNALLSKEAGVVSADYAIALRDLAKLAAADPVADSTLSSPSLTVRDLHAAADTSPFATAFLRFLQEYGHRALYETEISNPRWAEDPRYVAYAIRALREDLRSPSDEEHGSAVKLPSGLTRVVVSPVAKSAAEACARREEVKSFLVKLAQPIRKALLEIGGVLVKDACLRLPSDVFELSYWEISALISNDWRPETLDALIEHRREEGHRLSHQPPADVVIEQDGSDDAWANDGVMSTDIDTLSGIGVSNGLFGGKVRKVTDPYEGLAVDAGSVIVAPSCDPGWSPVLLRAGAVVMEMGGVMSHAAIVARELGIPAVANVRGAMTALEDGEDVVVDGTQGIIRRSHRGRPNDAT